MASRLEPACKLEAVAGQAWPLEQAAQLSAFLQCGVRVQPVVLSLACVEEGPTGLVHTQVLSRSGPGLRACISNRQNGLC